MHRSFRLMIRVRRNPRSEGAHEYQRFRKPSLSAKRFPFPHFGLERGQCFLQQGQHKNSFVAASVFRFASLFPLVFVFFLWSFFFSEALLFSSIFLGFPLPSFPLAFDFFFTIALTSWNRFSVGLRIEQSISDRAAISFKSVLLPNGILWRDGMETLERRTVLALSDGCARRSTESRSACLVTPLPLLGGERRSYRGLGQPFALHSHDHYVIGRVRGGERRLVLNGSESFIGPGDLLVFNPGDVHGCTQESDGLFSYDSVTLSGKKLDGAILGVPSAKRIRRELRTAFDDALDLMNASREEEASEQILFLVSMLEVEGRGPSVSAAEDIATRVYAHLRGHLADPSSIAELAAAQGVSEYALIRAYRKRFAITPLQHLMALRVDCACELLAQGLTPSAVAAETGFADQAHLTRIFKQRIGTTPAAYARMAVRGS